MVFLNQSFHEEDTMLLIFVGFSTLTVIIGLSGGLSLHLRWVLIMLSFVAFLALVGKRVTSNNENGSWQGGRWSGILIDSRHKMSLSRFQITMWTILVLSVFSVIALDRTIPVLQGKYSVVNLVLQQDTNNQTADKGKSASKNEASYAALNIKFPDELLIVLGISTASLAGASIIKGNKTETKTKVALKHLEYQEEVVQKEKQEAQNAINELKKEVDQFENEVNKLRSIPASAPAYQKALLSIERIEIQKKPDVIEKLANAQDRLERTKHELLNFINVKESAVGDVHTNKNIQQADWSDMFRGELVSNHHVVDTGKVQMFFITIVILFTYSTLLWGLLGDTSGLRMAEIELPTFTATLTGLLGISHAGYLVIKQTGQTG